MENKSNLPAKSRQRNLPTVEEIYEDNLKISFKQDQFNLLLNVEPKINWIRENKFANNSKYIPVGIIETNLQKLFKQIKWEVLREGIMFNSIYVAVRLHYFNPATNEWSFMDGLGAQQVQVKKGSSPSHLEDINNNAVMMALPIAYAYGQKNAAKKLGKLFGRSLNRNEDTLEYDTSISIQGRNDETEKQRAIDFINNATSQQQLKSMPNELLEKYDLLDIYDFKLQNLK